MENLLTETKDVIVSFILLHHVTKNVEKTRYLLRQFLTGFTINLSLTTENFLK